MEVHLIFNLLLVYFVHLLHILLQECRVPKCHLLEKNSGKHSGKLHKNKIILITLLRNIFNRSIFRTPCSVIKMSSDFKPFIDIPLL
jgi:hypothetical protein